MEKTAYPLDLKIEDTSGDSFPDEDFTLLREYLHSDSTLTLESVARTIEDRLPEKDPLSTEVWNFGETCIEVAEQIPYYHPSQLKLAGLLEYLANSPKFGGVYETKVIDKIPNQYIRYQRLRESIRETLNGPIPEMPRAYVNFNAFLANLAERRITRTNPSWAIWAQRDAHEGREPCREEEEGIPRDIYILAAAQWILWYGQSFFQQVLFPGEVSSDDLRTWNPGPLYNGKPHLTLHRWHFWKDCYNAVASSGQDDEKGYSQECREVATKAAAMMDSLEANMSF